MTFALPEMPAASEMDLYRERVFGNKSGKAKTDFDPVGI